MRRLTLLLIVAAGLAPGTWVRSADRTPPDNRQLLFADRLRVPQAPFGEIEVAGAWHLRSPNSHFHGYSALVTMGDGTLLAVTDGARMMRFAPPGAEPPSVAFSHVAGVEEKDKRFVDAEAMTRDPASGTVWVSYEGSNQIERYDAGLIPVGLVRPAAMRRWPSNSGAEAMVRLRDGRFIVLSEGSPRWFARDLPGLLFPGDPVEGHEPQAFGFARPEGFVPVDMTLLPDGRVLILLRDVEWGLPPRFEAKLVVADPTEIRPGERWRGREIAHLAEPVPMDNYEGLAVVRQEDGALVLWLISDDNKATFQRTLLLKLLWRPNEKARELPRAPS